MADRFALLLSFLLLSVSVLSATSSSSLFNTLVVPLSLSDSASKTKTVYTMRCRGFVAKCYDDEKVADFGLDDEKVAGFGLEEAVRRGLAGGVRYISYDALKKDRVPCNRRGNSYYNCMRGQRANPYRRGCSVITRCKKIYN